MNPLTRSKNTTILPVLITIVLGCFGLSPAAQAQLPPPPPDGGYPGGNTAEGTGALLNLTTGAHNTAIGLEALFKEMSGDFNTATGSGALHENTTGNSNTATGRHALFANNGDFNTAVGRGALRTNTTGGENTASGAAALHENTTGNSNAATGFRALYSNTEGEFNTATGNQALYSNTTGVENTANGREALVNNSTGDFNTATGVGALFGNTTGENNIALGFLAGSNLSTGDFNIDIGDRGAAGESNTIRIGEQENQTRTFIAGISEVAVTGTAVVVDGNGQLGVAPSSQRFKDEIKPMDKSSEMILALKPVTFRYKKEIDAQRTPQFGLVAEEVEKVNPDLVARDADGKPYSVRYEAVNAMLLNEFLKEHRKVQQLEANDAEQQREIKALVATVKQQASQIQKVSAQLEASKPAPQMVLNY